MLGILPILLLFGENGPALAAGGLLVFLTGLIDDLWGLGPRSKLSLQLVATTIVVALIPFPGTRLALTADLSLTLSGIPNLALIAFWLVGGTNGFNLIDGLDGLAGGVAAVSLLPLFVINFGQPGGLLGGGAVSALIAVLIYNFYPAKLFLGDGGSYLVGFLTSYLVVFELSGITGAANPGWPLFVGILLLGIPVLDTLFAIGRRIGSSRGIMEADQKHLHHRLHRRFGHLHAVLIIYLFQAVLTGLGLSLYLLPG